MKRDVIDPVLSTLVKTLIEYQPARNIMQVPPRIAALLVLYAFNRESRHMNVRYVGYANNKNGNDARTLLQQQHSCNGDKWTHFSVYELWDHIQKDDTTAVDALFDHVYRHDAQIKTHTARRNKRIETQDNAFIPKQLFVSFINRISRSSSVFVNPRTVKQGSKTTVFE